MKNYGQPWNSLGDHFNTQKTTPDQGVIANLEFAWPHINKVIAASQSPARVLDFGCGTGALCERISRSGARATGIDISPGMIEVARKNFPSNIDFSVGGIDLVPQLGRFDLIVSLMVLQFVPDLAATLSVLSSALPQGGRFICSVHNDSYIRWPMNIHTRFRDIVEATDGAKAIMTLSGVDVPIFLRTESEYRSAFAEAGLSVTESYHSEPYEDGTPPKFLVIVSTKSS